jgi:hypothetical protein
LKNLERSRKESIHINENISYLENALKTIKNENQLIKESNRKLQIDYEYLLENSENKRKEFNAKLNNVHYLYILKYYLVRGS